MFHSSARPALTFLALTVLSQLGEATAWSVAKELRRQYPHLGTVRPLAAKVSSILYRNSISHYPKTLRRKNPEGAWTYSCNVQP